MRLPGLLDRISIRTQVTLATATLAIILVLGATIAAASLGRRILTTMVGDDMTRLAEAMATRLDRDMFERYRVIRPR